MYTTCDIRGGSAKSYVRFRREWLQKQIVSAFDDVVGSAMTFRKIEEQNKIRISISWKN